MRSSAIILANDRPIGGSHDALVEWAIDAEAILRDQQLVIDRLSENLKLVPAPDRSCSGCVFMTKQGCLATIDQVDQCHEHDAEWKLK